MTALTSPEFRAHVVTCPDCKSAPGQLCTTGSGYSRTYPHVAREKAAARAAKHAPSPAPCTCHSLSTRDLCPQHGVGEQG